MEKKRVGVIGSGMIGKQHVEALRRIPCGEVASLAEMNEALGRKTAEELAIPTFYTDYKKMIENEKLDCVHICTPNFTHFEISRFAIEAGVNVFSEKPMTNTTAEAEELVALAKTHNVVCGVDFNYRQNAMVQEMHERVAQDKWGKTYLVRAEYIQDWMMYDTDYNWRCVPALGGKSRTVADIGSHCFDTLQYILGERIVKVFAKLDTVIPQRKKFAKQAATYQAQSGEDYTLVNIDTEDMAAVLLEFESGIRGIVELSQVSAGYKNAFKVNVDGAAYSMSWDQENPDKLVISSRETGRLLTYASSGSMTGDANDYAPLPAGHPVAWPDAMKNGFSSFYSYLCKGGEKRFVDFEGGAEIVKLVDACLESNRTGAWVSLT